MGDALRVIADEEAEHAALAYAVVAWAIEVGGATVRLAAARAFDETLEHLEATPAHLDPRESHSIRAHGRLPKGELAAVRARAGRDIVRPLMTALLGGRAAALRPPS